jgi:hypothetical protein
VAPTYNPSHSGDRDQEELGSESAWANSFLDSTLKKKKTSQKRTGEVAQGGGLEIKP